MVVFPIDKYLAQDYRNTLRTSDAPQNIETDNPIIPMIDVQKGFPKPNSKQTYKTFFSTQAAAGTFNKQIATPTSNTLIYFVGIEVGYPSNTTGPDMALLDSTTQNTFPVENDTNVLAMRRTNTPEGYDKFPPLPLKVNNGIRLYSSTGVAGYAVVVHYIEEVIN